MKKYSFSGHYKTRAHIDLTPLIDLVFLLVIFFMVSSTIGKLSSIHINLPKAEKSSISERAAVVISINDRNEIYIGNDKVAEEDFQNTVNSRINELKDKKILIRGDKKTNYETIIKVMDSLNKSGISSFTLSTIRK